MSSPRVLAALNAWWLKQESLAPTKLDLFPPCLHEWYFLALGDRIKRREDLVLTNVGVEWWHRDGRHLRNDWPDAVRQLLEEQPELRRPHADHD
jgi:hypothetical protein